MRALARDAKIPARVSGVLVIIGPNNTLTHFFTKHNIPNGFRRFSAPSCFVAWLAVASLRAALW
ncbi:MAG: hypothetical protein P4L87_11790, partial [Formivibrio sp.]|nr:hypothetical protein [Formivibrio sp.]